MIVDTRI